MLLRRRNKTIAIALFFEVIFRAGMLPVGSNIWLYEPGIILSLHLARSALKKRPETRTRLTRANVRSRLTRTHVRAKEEHATDAVIL